MKKIFNILSAILLCIFLCTAVLAADDYAPNRIIVEFAPNVAQIPIGKMSERSQTMSISSSSIQTLNSKYRITSIERLFKNASPSIPLEAGNKTRQPDISNFYMLHLPEGADIRSAVAQYRNDPSVLSASLDYKRILFLTPNDPDFKDLPSYYNQWNLFKLGLPDAWNITTGSENITIAVIDTGVNYNHEDLNGKVILGYDYVNDDADPMDDNNHGTHVAGIVGAVTNNGKGIAGVSWGSKILVLKTIDALGRGYSSLSSQAVVDAADKGASVINMSYGGSYRTNCEEAAVNYAYSKGCVLVAAAGNYANEQPMYPAAYDHVIAVASTDQKDRKTAYSSYGTFVDICAPGGDDSDDPKSRILSAYDRNETGYVWMMGTSMSAPHVSGVAALIRSADPLAGPDDVAEQISDTADDIYFINMSYIGKLGAGRINAFRALNKNAVLSSIKNGSILGNTIQIMGTATHEAFNHYSIKWAPGISPMEGDFRSDGMVLANEGKISVKDGILGTWYAEGKYGQYSLKLSINDWTTLESKIVVTLGSSTMLGDSESGPNPFNPAIGEKTKIKYVLSAPTDVKLYIFDITGTLIYSKSYPAGDPDGGHTGTNLIEWDGSSKFGGLAANGAYLYKLYASGQQIGKGKIIVLK